MIGIRVRKPDVTIEVTITQHPEVLPAVQAWKNFTRLCQKHRVEVLPKPASDGSPVVKVKGRPRHVRSFKRDFDVLHMMGVI